MSATSHRDSLRGRPSRPTSSRPDAILWQETLDALVGHVAVLDSSGRVAAVNAAWQRFAAREGGEGTYLGCDYLEICRRADDPEAAVALAGIEALLAGERKSFSLDYPCHSPTEQRWFRLRATSIADGSGDRHVLVCHEDVTLHHAAEDSARLQTTLLDEIDAAVVVSDGHRTIRAWNRGAERLYGFTREEAIGAWLPGLLVQPDLCVALQSVDELQGRARETEIRDRDGESRWVSVRTRLIAPPRGGEKLLAALAVDITERKAAERSLRRAHDRLRAVTQNMGDGLFALDRDGYVSYVNPAAALALGWPAEEFVGRTIDDLTGGTATSATSVRAAGGFGAVPDGTTVRADDDIFLTRDGHALPVAYTAAPFETDDGDAGCVVVFRDITAQKAEEERLRAAATKLDMVRRVTDALAEDRLVLYSQPIIDLHSGAIVQRELLVRMLEPREAGGPLEPVLPSLFLPVAEEYGLIGQIDRWVVDRAVELATVTPVEVNVSARSISDPSFIGHVAAALRRSGADPGSVVLEITETALIDNQDAAREFVRAIRDLGCRVALDDFGTGYGGFTYLKRLQVDCLKIDIEFVRDLRYDTASRNVVQAVVGLARGFGLRTVAEGVEDGETLALLRDAGVDMAQGYHIGCPEPLPGGERL